MLRRIYNEVIIQMVWRRWQSYSGADSSDSRYAGHCDSSLWRASWRSMEQRKHRKAEKAHRRCRTCLWSNREHSSTRRHQIRQTYQRSLHWQLLRKYPPRGRSRNQVRMLQLYAGFWLDQNSVRPWTGWRLHLTGILSGAGWQGKPTGKRQRFNPSRLGFQLHQRWAEGCRCWVQRNERGRSVE